MKHSSHPESLMMSYGYNPELSEGAVKLPLFQTSTFVFKTAEEGKAFFEVAYGLREREIGEETGLIYSRINNPNLEVLEDRLCLWDQAQEGAVFESGMAAISTVLLEFLKPGDLLLYSQPTYGGTDHFINHFLEEIGVDAIGIRPEHELDEIIDMVERTGKGDSLSLIYIESPANPTNDLFDLAMCRKIADYFSTNEKRVHIAVDNTFMGPVWSHPLQHGADLVLYSATKYIGGHSDLIAGAVLGSTQLIKRVKVLRTFLGNMASPHTCWLLLRSLETLKVRMDQQAINAQKVAAFLSNHPLVDQLHYLGELDRSSRAFDIFQRQYLSPGAMISFEIKGGEREAFHFLNRLRLIKMAVSLGSTESLAQHPASMTHIGMDPDKRVAIGITDSLVRISIGLEHADDLIRDIGAALEAVDRHSKVLSPS